MHPLMKKEISFLGSKLLVYSFICQFQTTDISLHNTENQCMSNI